MSARVLVVEDEEDLRLVLADNLEEQGLTVQTVDTAAAAWRLLDPAGAGAGLDLVILDVMLPDGDGHSLCRRYRAAGGRAAILMLTARRLEDDLVAGLAAGADDYLAKPYRLRELQARVAALLRRTGRALPPGERLGALTLDREARTVTGPAGPIALTRTEFDLLAHLVAHAGRARSRDDLLDAVWGADVVVDPRTVDNFIMSLKRKLAWAPSDPWRIATVRSVGYRLERA